MIWMTLLRKGWPLLLWGLLLFGAWQMVQSHRSVSEEKGRLQQRVETLRDDLAAADAVADVLADQADDERKANRKLAAELNHQRGRYEHLRKELRDIARGAPAGDCLLQPVDPGVDRLLRKQPAAGAAEGPGMPDPGKPGTP